MNQASSRNDPQRRVQHAPSLGADISPSGSGEPEHSPESQLDSLSDIVAEIERFLAQWMQRFDHLLQQAQDHSQQDAAMRQRMAEFDEQCRQWETQRQRDARELHEKADQLSEAWLRLEAEQRELLQTQASLKHRGRDLHKSATSSNQHTSAAVSAGRGEVTVSPSRDSAAPSELSTRAAAEQFELLRHEISNHTPTAR